MKNFRKILFLLIAVVFIVTAFTVTALADEEPTLNGKSFTQTYKLGEEGKANGTFIGVDATLRHGYIYSETGEDGNYYAVFRAQNTGNSKDPVNLIDSTFTNPLILDGNTNDAGVATKKYTYNMQDYPYVVLNFDAMSPTGNVSASPLNFNIRVHQTKDSASATYIGFPLNFYSTSFANKMSLTPYDWQHITIVIKMDFALDEAGIATEAYATYSYYINGVLENSGTSVNMNEKYSAGRLTGYLPEDLGYYGTRLNAGTADSPKSQLALDNISVSYYTADYGYSEETRLDDIVRDGYDENYVLPYGRTVAMIGETKYEDIHDAIEAAQPGDTVKLMRDQDEAVVINKCINIDRNNGEGGLYTISFSHLAKYLDSEKDGILTISEKTAHTAPVSGTWESKAAGTDINVSSQTGRYGHIFVA